LADAIAHRFNNWLQVVNGNLDLVLASPTLDATTARLLNDALQAARAAAQASRLMLTYLGQDTRESKPLDLSELCLRSLPLLWAALPVDPVTGGLTRLYSFGCSNSYR
jgi:hypothetical protein